MFNNLPQNHLKSSSHFNNLLEKVIVPLMVAKTKPWPGYDHTNDMFIMLGLYTQILKPSTYPILKKNYNTNVYIGMAGHSWLHGQKRMSFLTLLMEGLKAC